MPIARVSPAPDATIRPTAGRIPWEVQLTTPLSPVLSLVYVEIASRNLAGQDGTLADDFVIDMVQLSRSDAFPTLYRGVTDGIIPWARYPGTYYWQASTDARIDPALPAGQLRRYVSGVHTLRIGNPSPPPVRVGEERESEPFLHRSTAIRRAKRYVRNRYRARRSTARCTRLSRSDFECRVRWRSRGRTRSRLIEVYYRNGRLRVSMV